MATRPVAVSAAEGFFLFLMEDGTVRYQGPGSTSYKDILKTLNEVQAISVGYSHALALRKDGTVVSWGRNAYGECNVPPGLKAVAIAAGGDLSMALTPDGTVQKWGDLWNLKFPPNLVAKAIAAGYGNYAIIRADGSVFSSGTLVSPPAGLIATAVAVGRFLGAAITPEGKVILWGDKDATSYFPTQPVQNVKSVAVGSRCGIALHTDGTVTTWGPPNSGLEVPPDLGPVVAVSAAGTYFVAVTSLGKIRVWGKNPPATPAIEAAPSDPSLFESVPYTPPVFRPLPAQPIPDAMKPHIPQRIPPGFEVRPYPGDDGEVIPLWITTIPKGTLLFRGFNTSHQLTEDIAGIRTGNTYCCSAHYMVYFYPFPFVDATVKPYGQYAVYVLLHDIKLACFMGPAPLSRADRLIEGMPHTACNKVNFGCGLKGREYDPCLTDAFQAANPDVVGMIGIARQDRIAFQKQVVTDPHYKTYVGQYTDSHSLVGGIPELVLMPHTRALAKDAVTTIAELTSYASKATPYLNYALLHVMKRTDDTIKSFIDQLLSPEGFPYQESHIHAKLNQETGFYQILELSTPFPVADTVHYAGPGFRFTRPSSVRTGARRTRRRHPREKQTRRHRV